MIIKFADVFEDFGCPSCSSDQRHLKFKHWGLDYQRCEICRLVYVSPCPNADARSWYLNNSKGLKYWRENLPATSSKSRLPIYLNRFNFIKKVSEDFLKIDKKILLEVGAGNGELAEILVQNNMFEEIILVEPQPLDISLPSCRVIQEEISNVNLTKLADVVIAFEVLEHINDPKKFLHDLGNTIAKGGLLIMSTPNIDSLEIACLGGLSDLIMFDHVRLYSPKSIKYLLNQEGWDLELIETPGLLDIERIKNNFHTNLIDLATDPALRFICDADDAIMNQFQSFIQDQLLSSHMQFVARKR